MYAVHLGSLDGLLEARGMLGDVPAGIPAQLDPGKLSKIPADVQAQITAGSSPQGQQQIQSNGTAAAEDLLSNGWSSDDQKNGQAVMAIMAAGASLVCPPCGAAVYVLYGIGKAIAPYLVDLGLIDPPGCRTSGNWTPDTFLRGRMPVAATGGTLPTANVVAHADGSSWSQPNIVAPSDFAKLAVQAYAIDVAARGNCQQAFGASRVFPAVATVWNKTHAGPTQMIWFPDIPAPMGVPAAWDDTVMAYAFAPVGQLPDHFVDITLPFGHATSVRPLDMGFALAINAGPKIHDLSGLRRAIGKTAAPSVGTAVKVVGGGVVVSGLAIALWYALGQPLSIEALKALFAAARGRS